MNVSIIIGTYGDDEWEKLAYERALPSAQAQDALEVLIGHDDEGTVASCRNDLAAKAEGDWLCFLDADDELAPGYLQAMRRVLERERRGEHGTPPLLLTPAVSYVQKGRRRPPRFHTEVSLELGNWLVVGTLLERYMFEKVGGFPDYPHGFEDWALFARCWKEGADVRKVPRAVYIAYINPNSKHREGWKDRAWQVATHQRIQKELFP